MSTTIDDVTCKKIQELASNRDLYTYLDQGTSLYRVQESKYEDGIFFSRSLTGRYSDSGQEFPVFYGALTPPTAIAESLQHGRDGDYSPVTRSLIKERSLFELQVVRKVPLIDVSALVGRLGYSLSNIVQKKGEDAVGYNYTQRLCSAVLRAGLDIDGMVYPSCAYPKAYGHDGACVVLFHGNNGKLKQIQSTPLEEYSLSDGRAVVEFLEELGVYAFS